MPGLRSNLRRIRSAQPDSGERPAGAGRAIVTCAALLFGVTVPFWPAAHAQQPQPTPVRPIQTPESGLAAGAAETAKVANPGNANIQHGLQIVMGETGTANQVTGCKQCHQIRGDGSASAGIPRLTGQTFRYIYSSLRNFASGDRKSPVMEPIAKELSDQDMRDVAAYYAAVKLGEQDMAKAAVSGPLPKSSVLIEGAALAAVGSAKDGVQACQNCHGPAGSGLPPVYPYLGGQYAGYLESQLLAFKSGARGNEELKIMQDIAKRLTDQQIHAVAIYYASIQPPHPLAQKNFAGTLAIGAPLGVFKKNGKSQPAPAGEAAK